jgi:Sap, sulfolipid-1-addressing protein
VDPVTLVLLALAAAVYPTLLAGVILILAPPAHAVRSPGRRIHHQHDRRHRDRPRTRVLGGSRHIPSLDQADAVAVSALLQLLVFNVVMFALVEIPIVAYVVNPQGAAGLVERASKWGHEHSRELAIALATIVGAWLIAKGIIAL